MKEYLPKIIGVVALLIVAVFLYSCSQKKSDTEKTVARSSQEILIENKGLAEFNAENDTINDVSVQDKKIAEEIMPIFKEMGNGKDMRKTKQQYQHLGKLLVNIQNTLTLIF